MAIPGYISSQLAALGGVPQRILTGVFEYVLSNLKIGAPEHQKRAANMQWYCLRATSPATPNETFSIEHGLTGAPYVLLPVLDPRVPGSSIDIAIPRAADDRRIFLACAVANAAVTVYVEGE